MVNTKVEGTLNNITFKSNIYSYVYKKNTKSFENWIMDINNQFATEG